MRKPKIGQIKSLFRARIRFWVEQLTQRSPVNQHSLPPSTRPRGSEHLASLGCTHTWVELRVDTVEVRELLGVSKHEQGAVVSDKCNMGQ